MKKIIFSIVAITAGLCMNLISISNATASVQVAVLPFNINSSSDLDFLKDGIQDMLSSRLSWGDKVIVIDKNSVNRTAESFNKFTGKSRALLIGAKLQADYIIYGSLTIFGESASIDAHITDIAGREPSITLFNQTSNMGQIIPEINNFATKINETVFQREIAASVQPAQSHGSQGPAPSFSYAPKSTFITKQAKTEKSRGFSVPNKSFIPVSSPHRQGNVDIWKSNFFNEIITGMDFGDVNNDGIPETILTFDHHIDIYKVVENRFVKISTIAKNRLNYYIGVDVGDINENGIPEIFVTSLAPDRTDITSMVLEFNGSKYVKLVNHSPWQYRIVDSYNSAPVLIGQKMGFKKESLFSAPVFIMDWTGKTYAPGEQILDKKKANILGSAYGDLQGDGDKNFIAFNPDDYISVFENKRRSVWTESNKSGGNMNYFSLPQKDPNAIGQDIQYFPMRLRTGDMNQDGNPEIITACNYDTVKLKLTSFRSFSKSYIKVLTWDGLGLSTIWKTRVIPGRTSDFFIGDFDHDGIEELVISLITKEGLTAFSATQSRVVAYELSGD